MGSSSSTMNTSVTQQLIARREQLSPTSNKYKIALNIRDGLLAFGNPMVSVGNYLLYKNGLLPLAPALCFIVEAAINGKIATTNLLLRSRNIDNRNVTTALTALSFLTSPLLPLAVFLLNWPTPNPATIDVTYCFGAAATVSFLNHIITMVKNIKEECVTNNAVSSTNQQTTVCQKLGNTLVSMLAPISIASATAGVSIFASHELGNVTSSDDDKSFLTSKSAAFYEVIAGLTIVSAALLVNTGIQLYKNWCTNPIDDFDIENIDNNLSTATSSTSSLISNDSDEEESLVNKFNAEVINDQDLTAMPTTSYDRRDLEKFFLIQKPSSGRRESL